MASEGCLETGEPTAEEMAAEEKKIKAAQSRTRRAGVAAESVDRDALKDYKKPVYAKSDDVVVRIQQSLKDNEKVQVLIGHLTGSSLDDVVNAFHKKEFTEGTDIIKQGDNGDCLYIIKEGKVDIFVARPGTDGKIAEGDKGAKVLTLDGQGLFGELALMYHAPRAATVTAVSPNVETWVLDAVDFKMLLMQSSQAQYAKYEGWLSGVSLLKTLNQYELSKLADALETEHYEEGGEIVKQGDVGDRFFILAEGTASAFMTGESGEKEVKKYETVGDYFGEIALLTSEPRKATIRAVGDGCTVVYLMQEKFTDLLGPIKDILKDHVDKYPQYADFLK